MAGSRNRKSQRRKGKSRSQNHVSANQELGSVNSGPDLEKELITGLGNWKKSKGVDVMPDDNSSFQNQGDSQLENLLRDRLHMIYLEAFAKIKEGVKDPEVVKRAMLKNGFLTGPKTTQENIISNTMALIEYENSYGASSQEKLMFKGLNHLVESQMESLICKTIKRMPVAEMTRSNVVRLLLEAYSFGGANSPIISDNLSHAEPPHLPVEAPTQALVCMKTEEHDNSAEDSASKKDGESSVPLWESLTFEERLASIKAVRIKFMPSCGRLTCSICGDHPNGRMFRDVPEVKGFKKLMKEIKFKEASEEKPETSFLVSKEMRSTDVELANLDKQRSRSLQQVEIDRGHVLVDKWCFVVDMSNLQISSESPELSSDTSERHVLDLDVDKPMDPGSSVVQEAPKTKILGRLG